MRVADAVQDVTSGGSLCGLLLCGLRAQLRQGLVYKGRVLLKSLRFRIDGRGLRHRANLFQGVQVVLNDLNVHQVLLLRRFGLLGLNRLLSVGTLDVVYEFLPFLNHLVVLLLLQHHFYLLLVLLLHVVYRRLLQPLR